jgi:hypothetical protein
MWLLFFLSGGDSVFDFLFAGVKVGERWGGGGLEIDGDCFALQVDASTFDMS